MKRWAALLRGVNLGGRKLLSTDLQAVTESLGYTEARTLLASGNVVFATTDDGPTIERKLEHALEKRGLKTDVLVRDLHELRAAIAANPFEDAARDHPSHLLVTFHRDPFPEGLLARIPEIYEGPERLHAHGRELFTDYPVDMGHSKLPQATAKAKFPKIATGRNWNTVNKLVAMLEE